MKKVFTLLMVCASIWSAKAQFCEPSDNCFESQVICGALLDGLTGMTMPTVAPPPQIPSFICGVIDNPSWLGFVPCEPSVTFTISVGNCVSFPPDVGLQAAILDAEDCGNPIVINCNEQIFPNSMGQISASGLIPGQVYYLLIDGYSGDLCDFEIFIDQGVNTEFPNNQQVAEGYIDGPLNLPCGGGQATYMAVLPICEAQNNVTCVTPQPIDDCYYFDWTIPLGATFIGDSTTQSVLIDFSGSLGGTVSVEMVWDEDSCGDEACFCETCPTDPIPPIVVSVESPTTVTLPPLEICESDNFEFCGTTYEATESDTFYCQIGCETTIQEVIVFDGVFANIVHTGDLGNDPSVLLENDSFELGTINVYFWEGPGIELATAGEFTQTVDVPGIYTLTVTNPVSGCTAQAQTIVLPGTPCSPYEAPIAPSDDCSDAPPFCDGGLQGYCSVNAFNTPNAPGALSCSIENNQWISFTACADTVKLFIEVTNCLQATGLEFSIFEDCNTPVSISDCESIADGDTLAIVAPSSSGQVYQLMIDGINGDICQWRIIGTEGISDGGLFQEDNTPGQVEGPTPICLDMPVSLTYTFTAPICNLIDLGGCPAATQQVCIPGAQPPPPPCEIDTVWSVTSSTGEEISTFAGGDSTGASITLNISDSIFIPPGGSISMLVSVNPFHVSNPFPSGPGGPSCGENCFLNCATIIPDEPCTVDPLEVILCKPDIIPEFFVICPGECIDFLGETFCAPGTYEIIQFDVCGCEDKYIIEIVEEQVPPPPFTGNLTVACDPGGLTYSASFDIFQNFGWDVIIDGSYFPGSNYTVSGIPSGSTFEVELEYIDWFCGFFDQEIVSGVHDCPCISQSFNEGLITLCPGDCYDLAGNVYCAPGHYEELIFNPISGCDDLYIFDIENIAEDDLSNGPVTELCNFLNTEYTVTFTITDGVEPFYVNGAAVGGTLYQSDPIPSGDPYVFQITDSGQCDNDALTLAGAYACACLTDPGTVGVSLLSECEDNMVTATYNNDATLDGDDILVFILHTEPGASLGDVLGTNITGTFGFVPGIMQYGVTYFISAVAGNDMGGNVDLGDSCLGVSVGQPVVFYENPELDLLSTGIVTCIDDVPLDAFPMGGSGQFTYQWNGPGVNSTSATATASQGGIFTCVLTDEVTGCTASASVSVDEDTDEPEFEVVPPNQILDCNVSMVEIFTTSSQTDLEYSWSIPSGGTADGSSVIASTAGAYTVIATAPNGCTAEAGTGLTSDYSLPENIQATEGEITCDEPVVNLNGSSLTSNVTFEWTSPSGNLLLGDEVPTSEIGEFTLVVTGANGCTAETTTGVTANLTPPQALDADDGELTCDEPLASLEVTSTSSDVEFTWFFPSGNEVMGNIITTDIDGEYTIIATGTNGCTSQTTAEVLDLTDPPEDVTATDGQLTCDEPLATLSATSSTPDVTFTWVFPTGGEVDGNQISTNVDGGYTLIATASNGCTAEAQSNVIDLTEPPEDVTATNGEITCEFLTTNLEATSSTLDVIYTWIFPSGEEVDGAIVSADETGTYTLVATAPNGCSIEVPTQVLDNTTPPTVTVNDGEVNCEQPEVTLFAGSDIPGSVFSWTLPNGSNADGASLNTSESGGYEVIVQAPNGCETTETTQVVTVADPEIGAQVALEMPSCAGDSDASILIETTTGGTEPYALTVDGEPLMGALLENLSSGTYQLGITDANGCTGESMLVIPEPEDVNVSLGDDLYVGLGDPVILEMQSDINPADIEWNGPDGQMWSGVSSLTIQAMVNGTYTVEISDENGCSASDALQIFVEGAGTVYVPNVFSPNGDEVNDILTVFAGGDVTLVRSFSVFNRWGDLIYEGENFAPHTTDNPPTVGWDGTHKGKPLDPAVFVFMAEVEFLTGETKMITGDVTLLK